MWKDSKSGDDMVPADRGSMVMEPKPVSFDGTWSWCCSGRAYVWPALRNVANRASLTGVGAHGSAEPDEAELTEDVREQRDEVSDTIDSGDDREESERTDGRRLGNSLTSGGTNLAFGQRQSYVVRAMASRCALAMAEQNDSRRDPEPA